MMSRSLIARSTGPAVAVTPEAQHVPTSYEWAERHSEIERLYVHERRKLRFIMMHMEREHGFKATEQMYKKRFAKWGFQKNTKRSVSTLAAVVAQGTCQRPRQGKRRQTDRWSSLYVCPRLSQDDALSLRLLTAVRNWDTAFFESAFSGDRDWTSEPACPERAKEISFTLKLVSELLSRGHGVSAGRLARKAFLLVEDMLMFEGPAIVWNLFEIMYHMLILGHEQLFCMLLSHLFALAGERLSSNHPLATIMRDLKMLAASKRRGNSLRYQPFSTSQHRCASMNDAANAIDSNLFYNTLSALIKEAWVFNAETIFKRFDPRLSQLYFHLHWEACSINLPSTIVRIAKQWLKHIETNQEFNNIAVAGSRNGTVQTPKVAEGVSQRPFALEIDASSRLSYETLLDSSLEALSQLSEHILSEGSASPNVPNTPLRVIPALVKAKILQNSVAYLELSSVADLEGTQTPRSRASIFACVVRALMDMHADNSNVRIEALPDAVERIRWIIALREYAYGETDPQVMQEMWILEDALTTAGDTVQAEDVRRCVISRINRYTQDVAYDSV